MRTATVNWGVGGLAVAVLFLGVRATWAAIDGAHGWGTVPYQGFLEKNGVPVNGTADFCFRIFGSAGASTPIWAEPLPAVVVSGGHFQVRLGATQHLNAAVEQAADLFLQVAVADPGQGGTCDLTSLASYTALEGLQQLGAVGYALNAKQAVPNQDFLVTGRLGIDKAAPTVALDVVGQSAVTSHASVGGDLTVAGAATVGGGMDVGGAMDVGRGLRAGNSSSVTGCGMGVGAGEGMQRYNYGSHAMEYCNGTAWVSTVAQHFTQTGLALATGFGVHSVAHGLGALPSHVEAYLVCTAGEHGYSPGDHILASATGYYASGDISRLSVWMNATSFGVGYHGSRLFEANKTTGVGVFLTPANWTLTLRAWK